MSELNWRERRPLAPPSRKEDLMGGSNSFLLFLFSSAGKKNNNPQNISWGKGDTHMLFNVGTPFVSHRGNGNKSKERDKNNKGNGWQVTLEAAD